MERLSPITMIFILVMLKTVESVPAEDYQLGTPLGTNQPWHDVVIRRFYGPWSVVRKRDGGYVDYNDYGAVFQELPNDVPDFTNVGQSVGYLNDSPSPHDTILSKLKSIYRQNPVGLAVFATGVRNSDSLESKVSETKKNAKGSLNIDERGSNVGEIVASTKKISENA